MQEQVRYAVGKDSTVDKLMEVAREEGRAEMRAYYARLEAALVEVGDFLADDCVENYPFDRIPGSFADEADRLLKLIKASVEDAA